MQLKVLSFHLLLDTCHSTGYKSYSSTFSKFGDFKKELKELTFTFIK